MPAGRPTDYDDGLGERIIAHMKKGFSITAAAAKEGLHRQRIYDWAEKHPEFSDAINLGRGLRVAKLETDLMEAESGPMVTSRIFALKNADAHEWRERVDLEHTGKDGGPIQTEDMTDREVARRLAWLLVKGEQA